MVGGRLAEAKVLCLNFFVDVARESDPLPKRSQ
jgi:hypothetical protein